MRLLTALTLLALAAACGSPEGSTLTAPEATPSFRSEEGTLRAGVAGASLGPPVASITDDSAIREGFSLSASSPWGFEHHGIDFTPNPPAGTLMPVVAAEAGKVLFVDATLDGGHWRVNVGLQHAPDFRTEYVLEPFTGSDADRDAQLALVGVTVGQTVGRGALIARLRRVNDASHLHFGIRKANVDVCPAPYFIPLVRSEIRATLQETWPGAELCYP